MTQTHIRPAVETDAERIADIYNHYVRTTTVTFDTEPKTVEDRVAWLASRDERHPVLVAELDGRVVAFGTLSQYRERPAWAHTAEVGVYVAHDARGQRVGSLMLAQLVASAKELGLHALVSQIVGDNEASLRMTESVGFDRVGTLREVGRKFDTWLDVVILELVLD